MRAARYSRRQMRSGPLVLVNRQHPLAEEPRQLLTAADERYPNILLERQAARLLAACIQAAGGAREIVPVSGWRSQAEQQAIWEDTLQRRGEAFTRQYVAVPGCSEHQTGLAIDLGRAAREIDFIRPDFPEEGACGRFRRLAPRYGFIQRYHREKESLTGGDASCPADGAGGPVPGGVSGLGADSAQDVPPGTWAERTGVLHALRRR